MKNLLFLAAIMVAILLPVTSFPASRDLGTLTGQPVITNTVMVENNNEVKVEDRQTVYTVGKVDQGGTVNTTGNVNQGGEVKTYGSVDQGGTVTTIGRVYQGGDVNVSGNINVNHKWVNNPQSASTKTRTRANYRDRQVVAAAPPVTVNNYIPTEKPVAPVYNIYTTTPLESPSTTAGTAGKGNTPMDNVTLMWIVLGCLGAAVAIIAIIMTANRQIANDANAVVLAQQATVQGQTNQLTVALANQLSLGQLNGRKVTGQAHIFPNGGGTVTVTADDSQYAAQNGAQNNVVQNNVNGVVMDPASFQAMVTAMQPEINIDGGAQ